MWLMDKSEHQMKLLHHLTMKECMMIFDYFLQKLYVTITLILASIK